MAVGGALMYEVILVSNQKGIKAHTTGDPIARLHNMSLDMGVKTIDTFDFSIRNDNPASYAIEEKKTLVLVKNLKTGEIVFEGPVDTQNSTQADITERRYTAADAMIYLRDSLLMPKSFVGKPSELLRFIINRHNSLVEPEKQFAVGTVEIDTYIAYGSSPEAELVAVSLRVGDTATIKPSTTKIYDWNGNALNIANYAKGVAHTITDTRMLNGVKQYLLSRTWPSGVTTQEGFINESDIVEATDIISPDDVVEPDGELTPGTEFKIREGVTTYYGSSDGGGAKTIPSEYRTFTYKVSSHGLYNGMYGMVYNGTVIAWIPSGDVVRVDGRDFDVITPPAEPQLPQKVGGRYPSGTKAKIKKGTNTYYWSADGTRPTTIPQAYRTKTYTIREWSSMYKRYAIYDNGIGIAWIDESALDFGTVSKPSRPIKRDDKPIYVEKTRIIEAELKYSDDSYKAIEQHLLKPFGAEMEWETVEGVRTLHIRKRIENETNEKLMLGLNIVRTQLEVDPSDIKTVLIPIGTPPREESDEDGS